MGEMSRAPKKISDFDVKLGAVVRSKRNKLKLSQKEVADAAGIPMSNYQRREDGRNEITVSELERISVAVRVSPLAMVEEALADYGGLDKLIREHATSDATDNVTPEDELPYIGHVTEMPERIAAKKRTED